MSIENVFGTNFNDILTGNGIDNVLSGLAGNDQLTGGAGADTFAYTSSTESGYGMFGSDSIMDFQQGSDKIDLSAMDANLGMAGNQSFQYVAYDPNQTLQAGQVTSHFDATTGKTMVEANIDGSAVSEFNVALEGNVQLNQNDFNL